MSSESQNPSISLLTELFSGTFVHEDENSYPRYLAKVAEEVNKPGMRKIVYDTVLQTLKKSLTGESTSPEENKMLRGAKGILPYAPELKDLYEQILKETRSLIETTHGTQIDALIRERNINQKYRSKLVDRMVHQAVTPFEQKDAKPTSLADAMDDLTRFVSERQPYPTNRHPIASFLSKISSRL
jgi:hypothetical protein